MPDFLYGRKHTQNKMHNFITFNLCTLIVFLEQKKLTPKQVPAPDNVA